MRRLPVYFLLDTSGSMYGEPIQALNNALSGMVNTLRQDPQALDSLWLSMITFDKEVREIMPLTELVSFQLPEITCPQSGPTNMGEALWMLAEKVERDVRKSTPTQKGDWKPLLFILTDGSPSDLATFREAVPKIKSMNFGVVVGCAAGPKAREEFLKELTEKVVRLDTADSATLKQFFRWVSDSIQMGSNSQGTGAALTLPPPPNELSLVI